MHSWHADDPDPLYVPALQSVHMEVPFLSVYVPTLHSWHAVDPDPLYVPTLQSVQADMAPVIPYAPAEQNVHAVLPICGVYVPAEQG